MLNEYGLLEAPNSDTDQGKAEEADAPTGDAVELLLDLLAFLALLAPLARLHLAA